MAHMHTKECEDLKAAREGLRAQLAPPNVLTSPIDATQPHDLATGPVATADVQREIASVEQALMDLGCDYAER